MAATLIIDDRERNVVRHERAFATTQHVIKRLIIGDYAIVSNADTILATIERKSLSDYGASLKDGRHDNKEKLIELRETTGCRIIYIIEGPEFPSTSSVFGGIPYGVIEGSMFRLMMRDNIMIMRTQDTLGTAEALARLVAATATMLVKDDKPRIFAGAPDVEDIPVAAPVGAPTGVDYALALLTAAPAPPSTYSITSSIWAVFRGITVETAADYIAKLSLAQVIRGDNLSAFRTSTGRPMNKRVHESLARIDADTAHKLLGALPGFGASTVNELLARHELRALIAMPVAELAAIKIGKRQSEFGAKRATFLQEIFNFTTFVVRP